MFQNNIVKCTSQFFIILIPRHGLPLANIKTKLIYSRHMLFHYDVLYLGDGNLLTSF